MSSTINPQYPIQSIRAAVTIIIEHYPANGPHFQKLIKLENELQSYENPIDAIQKIKNARKGTGVGRVNAGLKRLQESIEQNKKIDPDKITNSMDEHRKTSEDLLQLVRRAWSSD